MFEEKQLIKKNLQGYSSFHLFYGGHDVDIEMTMWAISSVGSEPLEELEGYEDLIIISQNIKIA